jgi:hypothetical protein
VDGAGVRLSGALRSGREPAESARSRAGKVEVRSGEEAAAVTVRKQESLEAAGSAGWRRTHESRWRGALRGREDLDGERRAAESCED